MFNLVGAFDQNDIFTNFVIKNMMDHPLDIVVSKLNWECLKRVTFWNMIFDTSLELVVRECTSTYIQILLQNKFIICGCMVTS